MANHWHERFKAEAYMYGKEPNAFVKEIAGKLPKGGKVLCIAEGEGRNAVYLAMLGFSVTAWDYAASGLEKTKRLAEERNVTVATELYNLAEVEWESEQWDAIVHVFGHFPKDVMDYALDGVKKALKPGGYYLSELYTKEQLQYGTGGPSNEEMLVNPRELLETFESYFVEHFYVGEVHRQEGILHTGDAHVVQCLFQKRKDA